jgi:hypothetical protein
MLIGVTVLWWTSGSTLAGDPAPVKRDSVRELADAKAAAPYAVRYPSALPPGASLEHVDRDDSDGSVVAVDIWFELASGGRLHIWQTNTTDPISTESLPAGETMSMEGMEWSLVRIDQGSRTVLQLSTRLADGITVTVDAPEDSLDLSSLKDVAASLS